MNVPRAPITIGITVTFRLHSFFNSLAKSRYLSFFPLLLQFYSVFSRASSLFFSFFFFFLLTIIRSDRPAEIRLSVYIFKSLRVLCVLFSRTHSVLYIYHLFVWSNVNFLHNSQRIPLPTKSCLVLHSFYANLLHSLIM